MIFMYSVKSKTTSTVPKNTRAATTRTYTNNTLLSCQYCVLCYIWRKFSAHDSELLCQAMIQHSTTLKMVSFMNQHMEWITLDRHHTLNKGHNDRDQKNDFIYDKNLKTQTFTYMYIKKKRRSCFYHVLKTYGWVGGFLFLSPFPSFCFCVCEWVSIHVQNFTKHCATTRKGNIAL